MAYAPSGRPGFIGAEVAPHSDARDANKSLPTACRRCRKQKLRCSREQPACRRCLNISALCSYPPPPDRKLLALKRTQNARARAQAISSRNSDGAADGLPLAFVAQVSPGDAAILSEESSPTERDNLNGETDLRPPENWDRDGQSLSRESVSTSSADGAHGALSQVAMPSTKVGLFLIHLYFSHVYNANLLFHEQSLLSDYISGKIPAFVALSIFAIASIFLCNSPQRPQKDKAGESEMLTLARAICNRHSHEWAATASLRVLSQTDKPRLETIQACHNLGIYWFSRDQTDRTDIHMLLAYRTCRLLGFHIPPEKGTEIDEVYGELKRRCFWSCWITNCISQDNAIFKGRSWQAAIGLAFPSDDESFANGRPESTEAFNEEGQIVSLDGSPRSPRLSNLGELVKLFSLWWEIQNFVNRRDLPASSRISSLSLLDRQLETIMENLHPDLQYNSSTSFSTSKLGPCNLFFLHSFYHVCACVLHSSIVPVFSNTPKDNSISKKLVKLSTREAVTHSMIIMDISTAFLRTNSDMSRLPSMIGYALFVSCTVHFRSLATQGKLRTEGTGRFKAAISILEQLKEFWLPLRRMWKQLETAFRSAGVNLNALSSNSNRSSLTSGDSHIDVERIAAHDAPSKSTDFTDIYCYVGDQQQLNRAPSITNHTSQLPTTVYSPVNTTSSPSHAPAESLPTRSHSGTDHRDHNNDVPPTLPFVNSSNFRQPLQRHQSSQQEFRIPNAPHASLIPMSTVQEVHALQMSDAPGSGMVDIVGDAYDTMAMHMMGIGSGAGPDGDTWWDNSFEVVETDPTAFLMGGYPGGEGGGYFFSQMG